jgi:hypothetical protein
MQRRQTLFIPRWDDRKFNRITQSRVPLGPPITLQNSCYESGVMAHKITRDNNLTLLLQLNKEYFCNNNHPRNGTRPNTKSEVRQQTLVKLTLNLMLYFIPSSTELLNVCYKTITKLRYYECILMKSCCKIATAWEQNQNAAALHSSQLINYIRCLFGNFYEHSHQHW